MRLATTCRAAALALLCSTLAAESASAQQQAASRFATAAQGDTARIAVIRPRGGWATGVIAWTAPDSLGLNRLRQRDTVVLGRDNIARFEVKRGTKRSGGATAIGIIGGAAAGLLIGGYLGVAAECGRSCSDNDEFFSGVAGFLIGGTLGTIAGGVTGGIIGGRRSTERWVPVMP